MGEDAWREVIVQCEGFSGSVSVGPYSSAFDDGSITPIQSSLLDDREGGRAVDVRIDMGSESCGSSAAPGRPIRCTLVARIVEPRVIINGPAQILVLVSCTEIITASLGTGEELRRDFMMCPCVDSRIAHGKVQVLFETDLAVVDAQGEIRRVSMGDAATALRVTAHGLEVELWDGTVRDVTVMGNGE